MKNQCKWCMNDCINIEKKCIYCITDKQCYEKKKLKIRKKTFGKQKADKRMGSKFEFQNHQQNKQLLTESNMTPNSGATKRFKGDEQISGLISVMEELKTKVAKQANGNKSFTIKREWLEKLNKEAIRENKEFYYLKFRFHEDEDKTYCVTDSDIIMSFVKTITEDRKISESAQSKIEVETKRRCLIEAENTKLYAEIEYLKSLLKLKEHENGDN